MRTFLLSKKLKSIKKEIFSCEKFSASFVKACLKLSNKKIKHKKGPSRNSTHL